MSATGRTDAHRHASSQGLDSGRAGLAFSLLRAGVPARLVIVGLVSAVLWLAILWALA